MTSKPRPAMTVEAIAAAEGLSVSGARLLLSRALLKLRRNGLVMTCRELAVALEANRNTEHTVRRPGRAR
jgi:hypothetical protein